MVTIRIDMMPSSFQKNNAPDSWIAIPEKDWAVFARASQAELRYPPRFSRQSGFIKIQKTKLFAAAATG